MNPAPQPHDLVEVFISYSHVDKVLVAELLTALKGLERDELVGFWHDGCIEPGREWASQINMHLNSSHLILLIVSADFIKSDYAYKIEMKRALERHYLDEARVIPIILRPTDWEESPLGRLQALPTGGKAITGSGWKDRDEAFVDVSKGIRAVIKKGLRVRPRTVSGIADAGMHDTSNEKKESDT